MGLSFSAGGTGWAAVELKPKSIWVVQPYEFLVSVMVDLDPAMPQTCSRSSRRKTDLVVLRLLLEGGLYFMIGGLHAIDQ
jgi:hypothetical protein